MRRGPVTALAGDIDKGGVNTRHQRIGRGQELAEGHVRGVVDAVDLGDGKAVHNPLLHHDLTTATIFLGGLEQERDPAREFAGFGQILGGPQKHGHMAIMAAGMHLAGDGGGMFSAGQLFDGQRIHIGAQANRRPCPLPVDDRNDAGLGDAGVDLIHADLFQPIDDEGGGVVAVKGQLGVLVQMTAPALHFFGIGCDTVENGHGRLLMSGL